MNEYIIHHGSTLISTPKQKETICGVPLDELDFPDIEDLETGQRFKRVGDGLGRTYRIVRRIFTEDRQILRESDGILFDLDNAYFSIRILPVEYNRSLRESVEAIRRKPLTFGDLEGGELFRAVDDADRGICMKFERPIGNENFRFDAVVAEPSRGGFWRTGTTFRCAGSERVERVEEDSR